MKTLTENVSKGLQLARTLRPFITSGPMGASDANETIKDIAGMIDNAIDPYKNIVEALSKIGIHSPDYAYPVHKVNSLVSKAIDLVNKTK